MRDSIGDDREWLEPDGLGGFASGTATGIRTRRYHALLLSAATPPTGRQVLIAGVDVALERGGHHVALSSQRYVPAVVHPDGAFRLEAFVHEPWPTWRFRVDDGCLVEQCLFVPKGLPVTVLRWRLNEGPPEGRLIVRPFFACRDYHSLQHENGVFVFDAEVDGHVISWSPYPGVQTVLASSNGSYVARPDWYRQFLYVEEERRGLDAVEDLAVPGGFEWDLANGAAVLILAAKTGATARLLGAHDPLQLADSLRDQEQQRRQQLATPLDRAADAYIVRRGAGATIVAGYPWFTDWGRDTFIAMRGLCLARGRYEEARDILVGWAGAVSEGMLPNRFPDGGDTPEFNAVDSSLWYIVAAHEWLMADLSVASTDRQRVQVAIEAILDGYSRGTRFGIHVDDDGLLAAGEPGVQLTWMDARVGDRVVTPRIGKPVEIQALWFSALTIGQQISPRWAALRDRAGRSFNQRFWNAEADALFDVVDVDHVRGTADASIRPNQILAIGGLPFPPLDGDRARRAVETVERLLWTPMGLRSLSPDDPAYAGTYGGGVAARDGAYHQGTVWPWLLGPFVEAWVRVRGDSQSARADARSRFLDPLLEHLNTAGLGHLPEVADGTAPHRPGGCPFQAWSVGEAVRLDRTVLAARDGTSADTIRPRRHRTRAVRVR